MVFDFYFDGVTVKTGNKELFRPLSLGLPSTVNNLIFYLCPKWIFFSQLGCSTCLSFNFAAPAPDITFNAALIGRVIFTGDVYSELQCIDICLRWPSCTACNMEILGSNMRCSALANIQRREKRMSRIGSFYRFFDREKIIKV